MVSGKIKVTCPAGCLDGLVQDPKTKRMKACRRCGGMGYLWKKAGL
jgi:hypothetical protein